MLIANGVQGAFLEYKGRPLVREADDIIYGEMSEPHYIYMMIMSYKEVENSVVKKIPEKIMVQLLPTDGSLPVKPVKQRVANGLLDAFETACAWLPALGE